MSAQIQPQQPVLLREDRDGIATLTMNRPAQMNLLTSEMLAALQEAWITLLEGVTHAERFQADERVARRVRAALAGHAPQGARVIEPPRAA